MAVTDLYNAAFMDHVSHPDYKYQMEDADCSHEGVNPSCGDELTFSVRFADDGTIEEAAFTGHGCAISQASADIMSDLMIDKTPEEARELCALFMRMVRGEETDEAAIAPRVLYRAAENNCTPLSIGQGRGRECY